MNKDVGEYSLSSERKEYLTKILKDYAALIEYPLWMMIEEDFIEPVYYTNYCQIINDALKGKVFCKGNQEKLFNLIKSSQAPEFSPCHGKLLLLGAPVKHHSKVVGIVACCQVLLKSIEEKDRLEAISLSPKLEISNKLGVSNIQLFIKYLEETRVLSKDKIRQIMDSLIFLSNLVSEIISGDKKLQNLTCEATSMNKELTLIHEVNQALSLLGEIDDIIKMILNRVMEIISVKVGWVIVREEKLDPSIIAQGISEVLAKKTLPLLKKEIFDKFNGGNNFVMINELRKDVVLSSLKLGLSSLLCVPLKIRGKIFGFMLVAHQEEGKIFNTSDRQLLTSLATEAALLIENAKSHKSWQKLFLNTITALTSTIDAKDPYTRGHSERVQNISLIVADELGLSLEEKAQVKISALFHDIGKIGITEKVLGKEGPLEDKEFEVIKEHLILGANIIEKIDGLKDIVANVMNHHERFDGQGYPGGLKGTQIPLASRIISVVDSYDAMTSDRPYRQGMTKEKAVDELKRCVDFQFDPKVVKAFVRAFEKGKI
ncbi:HD domain-containing protein [bacterium]|nr:HD domain-containing protein [bacterium]